MKLESEFIKLPFKFDVTRLQYELAQFHNSDWFAHPNYLKGNSSIPLISVNGEISHKCLGEMIPTKYLGKIPYIQQVLDSFGEVLGRCRLMRLDGACEVSRHSDIHYYWYDRTRIHIPIVTNEKVIFHCGDEKVHMAAGEAWLFDSWKKHQVTNDSNETRVHLVIDTCGSAKFWDMVSCSEFHPSGKPSTIETKTLAFVKGKKTNILTEKFNAQVIMAAGEVNYLVQDIINDAISCSSNDKRLLKEFINRANTFRKNWRRIWSLYGDQTEGVRHFQKLIHDTLIEDDRVKLGSNGSTAQSVFDARVLYPAINLELLNTGQLRPTTKPEFDRETPLIEKSTVQRLSRNAPCPCGSNKKYKHCCG